MQPHQGHQGGQDVDSTDGEVTPGSTGTGAGNDVQQRSENDFPAKHSACGADGGERRPGRTTAEQQESAAAEQDGARREQDNVECPKRQGLSRPLAQLPDPCREGEDTESEGHNSQPPSSFLLHLSHVQ